MLVTGSAGFIGGYVVQELLGRGHEVVGVDNFSKYGPVSHAYDTDPAYTLVDGDARDVELLTSLLEGCDHFIAGAAMIGGISYFHEYAYDLLATNERIIAASCDAAIAARPAGRLQKMTYLSSSMVFESTSTGRPARATSARSRRRSRPTGSRSSPSSTSRGPRGISTSCRTRSSAPSTASAIGERAGHGRRRDHVGNVKLAMSHVVPDLVQKVLKGQDPLHILGYGRPGRHYTYGGDLARGIVTAMEHPDALNDDFNLSTAESTTVLELAEVIWRKIKGPTSRSASFTTTRSSTTCRRRVPSVDKARDVLGFEATTTLDEMLDEVIPWISRPSRRARS